MEFRIGIRFKVGSTVATRYFQGFDGPDGNHGTRWTDKHDRSYRLFESETELRQAGEKLYSYGYRCNRPELTLFVEQRPTDAHNRNQWQPWQPQTTETADCQNGSHSQE